MFTIQHYQGHHPHFFTLLLLCQICWCSTIYCKSCLEETPGSNPDVLEYTFFNKAKFNMTINDGHTYRKSSFHVFIINHVLHGKKCHVTSYVSPYNAQCLQCINASSPVSSSRGLQMATTGLGDSRNLRSLQRVNLIKLCRNSTCQMAQHRTETPNNSF